MDFVKVEHDESIAIVRMARGKANAMNGVMIEALNETITTALNAGGVRGLVLASESKAFFSAGFDVTEVFAYDRDAMRVFFGRFIDLYELLSRSPKPVVAAINGHAFAGGAVLAIASDVRIMATGEFGYALNEINLGVILPRGVMRMALDATGARYAGDLLLSGRRIAPARALEIGLVDELCEAELLLTRAVERARELAQKPPETFRGIKQNFREVRGVAATSDRDHLEEFLDSWFSTEATVEKQKLIESLK